jgi:hypothetical protein
MPVSEEKLAANRANAEHSTGPVTADGKATSSQNATTHGLTGKTVLLPHEDKDEFRRFSAEVIAHLAPEGIIECEFAQMVANAQWRLRRIKLVEDGMMTSGEIEAIDPDAERKTVEEAETLARCFTEKTHAFSNLSQYEHRLYRTMTNALKHIGDLQAARNKFEEGVRVESTRLFNVWQFTRPSFGLPYPEDAPTAPPTNGDAATSRVGEAIPGAEPTTLVTNEENGQDSSPQVSGQRPEPLVVGFVFPTNKIQPPAENENEDENIAA